VFSLNFPMGLLFFLLTFKRLTSLKLLLISWRNHMVKFPRLNFDQYKYKALGQSSVIR